MKRLNAFLVLLLVCTWSQTAQAQAADWVSVSLKGDDVTVWMPKSREVKSREFSFDQFKLNGRVYTATSEGVDFIAWSLVDKGDADNGPEGFEAYLDACADLVWESLLGPHRDKLPKKPGVRTRMSYEEEVLTSEFLSGREYSIMMGGRLGLARFFVTEREIYVLIVLNLQAQNIPAAQRFIYSFGPKTSAPPDTTLGVGRGGGLGPGVGPGIGPGQGGNIGGGDIKPDGGRPSEASGPIDYNRVFSGKDVTQKARIVSKPEPSYTESARKYSVTGKVILRAVFSSSGEVTQIKAVSWLPHGLTARAIEAAKAIKFTPAQKDGHEVSMFIQLEYNFHLY